jgi:hypothetical protein
MPTFARARFGQSHFLASSSDTANQKDLPTTIAQFLINSYGHA